jgi:hypothetical protein
MNIANPATAHQPDLIFLLPLATSQTSASEVIPCKQNKRGIWTYGPNVSRRCTARETNQLNLTL